MGRWWGGTNSINSDMILEIAVSSVYMPYVRVSGRESGKGKIDRAASPYFVIQDRLLELNFGCVTHKKKHLPSMTPNESVTPFWDPEIVHA